MRILSWHSLYGKHKKADQRNLLFFTDEFFLQNISYCIHNAIQFAFRIIFHVRRPTIHFFSPLYTCK